MATINVYKTNIGSIVFVVGALKEGAPIVGVQPKDGATDKDAVAEIRKTVDGMGGLYFAMFGGGLNLSLLNEHEPVLIDSWEAEDIDPADFAEVNEAKE